MNDFPVTGWFAATCRGKWFTGEFSNGYQISYVGPFDSEDEMDACMRRFIAEAPTVEDRALRMTVDEFQVWSRVFPAA